MTQTKRKSRQPKVDAKSKELLVQKIQAGTVIDHITAGYALAVMQILGITGREGDIISIAMNVQSKRMKKKDI
ncbi:MAG: aspartate carbamoyltransferase regulatory subunit, partial [Promethearchaeota archaeon]